MPNILMPGVDLITRGVYLFACPVCHKQIRHDDSYGLMCTGPSETRDEHPPTLMRWIAVAPPEQTVNFLTGRRRIAEMSR